MRTQSGNSYKVRDERYFERKAGSLVVADEEIEAWELDAHDLDTLGDCTDFAGAPGSE
ncbi:MAG: hypothetical protein IT531_18055 [Burkholderiales bacterium]|nr:hypothetical protein [Burkholderiales bacterium]